jgi:tape measure domain-containing protein
MDIEKIKIAIDTGDLQRAKNELDKVEKSAKSVDKSVGGLTNSLVSFRGAVSAVAASAVISNYVKLSDTYTTIDSRLKLATKSTTEYAKAQEALFKISMDTRQSFEGTVDLFSKISTSTEKLKLSQQGLFDVIEAVNQASLIGGGSKEGVNAALIQLGQGFASGTLRGEELNSVLEQTPRLAKAIADSMGVATGDLRKLGEQGKITSEVLASGLPSQLKKLREESAQMGVTFAQATQNMETALVRAVGEFNNATGASATFANGINKIAMSVADGTDSIYELVDGLKVVATTAAIVAVGANGMALAMGTATIATKAFSLALKSIPYIGVAAGIAAIVQSYYEGKKGADAFTFSVNKLNSELELTPFKKQLADVSAELAIMDKQFAGYNDTQKMMYQGGYDALFKQKKQLEANILAIEKKGATTKKVEDEAKQSAMTQATNEKILIDLMDDRSQKIAKIKKETADLRKEGGNVVLIAEREAKLIREVNEEYDKKSLDAYNSKQKEQASALKEVNSAYLEMSRAGMSEYDKALSEIKEKTKEWIAVTGNKAEALKREAILIDELNKKKAEDDAKAALDIERQRNEQIDKRITSLNREYDLKEKQVGLIYDETERNQALTKLYYERRVQEIELEKQKKDQSDEFYESQLSYEKNLLDQTLFRYSATGQVIESVSSGMKSTMMDFFDYTSAGFGDLKKMALDLGNIIYKAVVQQMVVNPLVGALQTAATSYFATPTPTATGGGTYNGVTSTAFLSAKGNIFNSPSLSEYSNSVVSKPTMFAFANGGVPNMGIMGEKNGGSPEAIIPLTRTSNGDLGIKQVNTNSNNGVVKVEVINQTSDEVQVTNTQTRQSLEGTILSVWINAVNTNKMGVRTMLGK